MMKRYIVPFAALVVVALYLMLKSNLAPGEASHESKPGKVLDDDSGDKKLRELANSRSSGLEPRGDNVSIADDPYAEPKPHELFLLPIEGKPADYALVDFAYKHPNIRIPEAKAGELQDIFSQNYNRISEYQAAIARTRVNNDGSVIIEVPLHVKEGGEILARFLQEVSASYANNPPEGLLAGLAETFRGYTNNAGELKVSLTVSADADGNRFSITREIEFRDARTGVVNGSGTSADSLRVTDLPTSSYAAFARYFPPVPKPQ